MTPGRPYVLGSLTQALFLRTEIELFYFDKIGVFL